MEAHAFDKLEEQRDTLAQRADAARASHRMRQMHYERSSERFTYIVAVLAFALLALIGMFFDYMIALDVFVTRIVLWIALGVVFAAIARIMHFLVVVPAQQVEALRLRERRLQRRVAAIERYANGEIDADGIRMLYVQDVPIVPRRTLRGARIMDTVLGSALLLAVALFASIFF